MPRHLPLVLFVLLVLTTGCGSSAPTPTPTKSRPSTALQAAPAAPKELIFHIDGGRQIDHVTRLYAELKNNKTATTFRTVGLLEVESGSGECTTRYDRPSQTWAIEYSGSYGHEEVQDSIYGHYIYKGVTDKILLKAIAPILRGAKDVHDPGSNYWLMHDFGHNLRAAGAKEVFRFPLHSM